MRLILFPLLAAMAGPLAAQDLHEAALQRLRSDPAPFLDLAAQLIAAQGEAGAVGLAGVDRFVALERAMARARAMRLQMADGNFDGVVTGAELTARLAALAQAENKRVWTQFDMADGNGDGVLSAAELSGFGHSQAFTAFSEMDEAMLRMVLSFDADGDGMVSLGEVQTGVSALGT
jgi:hypothetical protein